MLTAIVLALNAAAAIAVWWILSSAAARSGLELERVVDDLVRRQPPVRTPVRSGDALVVSGHRLASEAGADSGRRKPASARAPAPAKKAARKRAAKKTTKSTAKKTTAKKTAAARSAGSTSTARASARKA